MSTIQQLNAATGFVFLFMEAILQIKNEIVKEMESHKALHTA